MITINKHTNHINAQKKYPCEPPGEHPQAPLKGIHGWHAIHVFKKKQ